VTFAGSFSEILGSCFTVQDIDELKWSSETLEAYPISQCSDYPNTDRNSDAGDPDADRRFPSSDCMVRRTIP
jgi:hypothetical protein